MLHVLRDDSGLKDTPSGANKTEKSFPFCVLRTTTLIISWFLTPDEWEPFVRLKPQGGLLK